MQKLRQGRGGGRKRGAEWGYGQGGPKLWSPFLCQASAQQMNTVQLGFFSLLN